MVADVAIEVRGLGKDYTVGGASRHGTLRDTIAAATKRRMRPERSLHVALDDLTFDVREGETVGFIGHNGAGKSTLLKVLSRITHPTRGSAVIRGRVGALLEVGTGFHPELTGRENVYMNGAILGMTRLEIAARYDEIVAFSGVERFLETPVKHYSSGMTVRLAFAVAAHIDPEILLVDEVLAVGDASFQRRCLDRLGELARSGRTILFVSHNMSVVQGLCTRGIVLEQGSVRADAPVEQAVEHYLESLEHAATVPLDQRADRQGSGPCRVTSIGIQRPNGGLPVVGSPAVVEVEVEPFDPTISCVMSIHDSFGLPVVQFDSSNRSDQDVTGPDSRTFRCELPHLLLRPGRYRLDVGLQAGKQWHDAIHAAAYFDVEQGRVAGRPALPDVPGTVVLPHTWTSPSA